MELYNKEVWCVADSSCDMVRAQTVTAPVHDKKVLFMSAIFAF